MKIKVEAEFQEWDGEDGFDTIEAQVIEEVAKRISKACSKKIITDTRAAVKAQIDESVHDMIEKALSTPIWKTNSWGEQTSEPQPLRQHIVRLAEVYMSEKVCADNGGKPGYRDKEIPRGEYFLKNVVARHLDAYYAEQIAAAVAGVKAELDGKLDAMVREAIKEVVS